jgi:16S rRNA (cytosine967-C5)-methyltransferase
VSALTEQGRKSSARPGLRRDGQRKGSPAVLTAPKPAITISPARAAAFAILERVANSSAHSDDLLHGPGMSGLSKADRNLATALVLGVLRWQIALDARLRPLLQRPDAALASPLATALRLGAFQLLHMDRIPAHAALSESVELARQAGHGHAAGMVNAVLRNLTRATPPRKPLVETTAALAERLGHPGWIVERWVKNYGRSAAAAICDYDQHEPPAGELFAQPLADGLHLDDGSRLVAELAAASMPSPARIWDCCAAPGGKSMVLAARHRGADVLASDVSARRLEAMKARLARELPGSTIRTLVADAAELPADEGPFDLILCDVPCSGTGTLGRNPEIRHHLRPSDLSRQARRQRELLAASLKRLRPGGRLVYSTCSLEPEENEAVVAEVLREEQGIAASEVSPLLDRLAQTGVLRGEAHGLIREGALRTLPGNGFAGDGFFAVVLEKQ